MAQPKAEDSRKFVYDLAVEIAPKKSYQRKLNTRRS